MGQYLTRGEGSWYSLLCANYSRRRQRASNDLKRTWLSRRRVIWLLPPPVIQLSLFLSLPVRLRSEEFNFQMISTCFRGAYRRETGGEGESAPCDVACLNSRSYFALEFSIIILFVQGGSPTPHPFSSRPHFVCKFSRQRSTEVFKTLAPRLTVLDIPYFADAYSRTMRPIDLHNF